VTGTALALRSRTPESWAIRAAAHLPELLADHAVCELQAAVFALSLVGMYPEDPVLVDRLSALAAEELRHFRRVTKEARRLSGPGPLPTKRRNHYVRALRDACRSGSEPEKGLDLLLVAALIEARSHERFERLAPHLDARLAKIYAELADDEARHGPIYLDLAARHAGEAKVRERLPALLDAEAAALTRGLAREVSVHGSV